MSVKKAYSRYRQATVETASPGKLVVMLYDGAIRFLNDALKHMDAKKPKESHFSIVRAENILCELMSSLDMERGGKISENLLALYEFMHLRLVEANIHKDPKRVRDVIGLLEDLRAAWAQAVEVHAKEQFRAKQEALPPSERTPSLETEPAQRPAAKTYQKTRPDAKKDGPKEGPEEPPRGFSIVS